MGHSHHGTGIVKVEEPVNPSNCAHTFNSIDHKDYSEMEVTREDVLDSLIGKGETSFDILRETEIDFPDHPDVVIDNGEEPCPEFEKAKNGTINTKQFKDDTGRTIRINGKKDYSKYSGRALREIRAAKAKEAMAGETEYADGSPIVRGG